MVLVMLFCAHQETQDTVIVNSLMGVSHSILILLSVTGNKLALKTVAAATTSTRVAQVPDIQLRSQCW